MEIIRWIKTIIIQGKLGSRAYFCVDFEPNDKKKRKEKSNIGGYSIGLTIKILIVGIIIIL